MIEVVKNILMLIVTIATYISFVPQIVKLIKTKKSEDIAISSWVIWVISSLAYLMFSLLEGGLGLIFSSVSEFVLTFVVLFLSIKYKRKES